MTQNLSDQEIISVLNKMFSSAETEYPLNLLDDIQQELQDIVDKFCFPGSQQIRTDIRTFENSLRDLIFFPEFANRYTVALGGGFNAGKSSILNCLFGDGFLPVGNTPTTSIPTTIIPSSEEPPVFSWCDHLGKHHQMSQEDFESISHDFKSESWKECSLCPLISSLRCSLPNKRYNNLIFLDTPGIGSKAGEDLDKKNAREMIQRSDVLIWVIRFGQGTETKSNLDFCREVLSDKSKPVYLLINIWNPEGTAKNVQKRIMDEIKSDFSKFNVQGVSVFSAEEGIICQGDSPYDWFDKLNNRPKRTHLYADINDIINKIKRPIEVDKSNLALNYNKAAEKGDDREIRQVAEYLSGKKSSREKLLNEMETSRKKLSDKLNSFLNQKLKIQIQDEFTHSSNAYGICYSKNIKPFSKGYKTPGKITLEIPELDKCIITCRDNERGSFELLVRKSELEENSSNFTACWYRSEGERHYFRLDKNDKNIDLSSSNYPSESKNVTFAMRYLYFFCMSAAMSLSCEDDDTIDAKLEEEAQCPQFPETEKSDILERCKKGSKVSLYKDLEKYLSSELKNAKLLQFFYAEFLTLSKSSSDNAKTDDIEEISSLISEKIDAVNKSFYEKIKPYLTGERFEFPERKSLQECQVWERYTKVIDLDQIDELVSIPAENSDAQERMSKISKEILWNIGQNNKMITNHSFLFQRSGKISIKGAGKEKCKLTFDHCNFFFYGMAEKNDFLLDAKKIHLVFKNCRFFGNDQRGIIEFTLSNGDFKKVVFQKMVKGPKVSGECIKDGQEVSFTECLFKECSGKYIVDKGKFDGTNRFIKCKCDAKNAVRKLQ